MTISNHAYERAKERYGMDKRSFRLFVGKAMGQGTPVKELTGKIWQYIKKIGKDDPAVLAESILYKSKVLLIKDETVVTCLYIPTNVINDWYENI